MQKHGNSKSAIETSETFEKYDDSADLVITISDKKLYCHSIFLKRISATFYNMVQMARNESTELTQVEIKLDDDVSHSDVIKILKYYYPNHTFEVSGHAVDVLVNLFETCHQFDCRKMKHIIYDYLDKGNHLKEHFKPQMLTIWLPSQYMKIASTVVSPEMKQMITRPDVLSSVTYCNRKYGYEEIAKSILSVDIKVEIFMWIFECLYKTETKKQNNDDKYLNELKDVETAAITNFFKIYFYENRTADLSVSKDSKIREIERVCPQFLPISPPGDCNIVVEDHTFAVSSVALSISSPVLKTMLTSSFKEGAEKVITLQGKKLEDIIELMNHLHQSIEIEEKSNILGLLPLCEEYQIDWLTEKIRKYMESSLSLSSQLPTLLTYLSMAENYGFQQLKNEVFKIGCSSKFIHLQMMKGFNDLFKETQVEFVCKTIIASHVNSNFAEHLWLLLKEQHLPAI